MDSKNTSFSKTPPYINNILRMKLSVNSERAVSNIEGKTWLEA
jgi:hypothetical protein